MIRFALALIAVLASVPTWAQSGQFQPNQVQAGPPSGVIPSFPQPRALVTADMPGGVGTTLLATGAVITSAPTVNATFCGKIAALTGSAFYPFTVGAASGFPGCTIMVVNVDSGRGKTMAINGLSFPNAGILWPNQTFMLKNVDNSWVCVDCPGRWKPAGGATFHVSSAGLDSNDGLAAGAGAFLTPPGAMTVIANILDANNQALVVQADCSSPTTFTTNIQFPNIIGAQDGGGIGSPTPTFIGNTTTPTNCLLDGSAGGGASTLLGLHTNEWIVEGFQIKNTAASCITIDVDGWIRGAFLDINTCNGASGNAIVVENRGLFELSGNLNLSAPAISGYNSVIFSTLQGQFLYGSGTISCTNSFAVAFAFSAAFNLSLQTWGGAGFSGCGSVTGKRYDAEINAIINTNGGGATFLPGNAGGTTATQGLYN